MKWRNANIKHPPKTHSILAQLANGTVAGLRWRGHNWVYFPLTVPCTERIVAWCEFSPPKKRSFVSQKEMSLQEEREKLAIMRVSAIKKAEQLLEEIGDILNKVVN